MLYARARLTAGGNQTGRFPSISAFPCMNHATRVIGRVPPYEDSRLTIGRNVCIAFNMQCLDRRDCHPSCRMEPCCASLLGEHLASVGGRLTRERVVLLQATCNSGGHFTPEELQRQMVDKGNSMALTTIYRNLPVLQEAGIIKRASIYDGDRATTYEHVWGREHHDHLVCSRCGRRVEFHYPALEILQEAVAKQHGFVLTGHHMEIVGHCADCAEEGEAQG